MDRSGSSPILTFIVKVTYISCISVQISLREWRTLVKLSRGELFFVNGHRRIESNYSRVIATLGSQCPLSKKQHYRKRFSNVFAPLKCKNVRDNDVSIIWTLISMQCPQTIIFNFTLKCTLNTNIQILVRNNLSSKMHKNIQRYIQ